MIKAGGGAETHLGTTGAVEVGRRVGERSEATGAVVAADAGCSMDGEAATTPSVEASVRGQLLVRAKGSRVLVVEQNRSDGRSRHVQPHQYGQEQLEQQDEHAQSRMLVGSTSSLLYGFLLILYMFQKSEFFYLQSVLKLTWKQ